MINIKPIHTERDYQEALSHIETLMEAPYGSAEGEELDVISTLIAAYEEKHYPIKSADPIEAIKFRMEQGSLSKRDLEESLQCGRGRVSEILNRKRPLSLKMIRSLSKNFKIPCEVLVQEYVVEKS